MHLGIDWLNDAIKGFIIEVMVGCRSTMTAEG
jgi:hypothetical protein